MPAHIVAQRFGVCESALFRYSQRGMLAARWDDTSARWLYWPVRASKGGPMIVPGAETDPIQIIDVRDLADFTVRCIEYNTTGVFNATGPATTLTMKAMVEGVIKSVGSDAKPTWIEPSFLESHGLNPQSFSLWIPPSGEAAGFHQRVIDKAVKAGLKFRPVEETARATMAWYATLPADIQGKIVPPMDPAKEAEVIEAWNKRS